MNEVHEKFIISIMTEPDSVPEADTSLWYRITHSRAIRQTMGIAASLLLVIGGCYLFLRPN